MMCSRLKLTLLALGLVYLFTFSPSFIFAHVLKTSGSVGAVVHVSPEDDPIAGEPTDFFFEFKDKEGKFTPENCDCKVLILKSGQEVYSSPLFQNNTDPSLTNASFSYTFPEKDIYKVKISGNPLTPDVFEAFNLEYDIRVARESENLQTGSQIKDEPQKENWLSTFSVPLIGGAFIVGLLIFALIKRQKTIKNS